MQNIAVWLIGRLFFYYLFFVGEIICFKLVWQAVITTILGKVSLLLCPELNDSVNEKGMLGSNETITMVNGLNRMAKIC
ncbi:hypothetical protein [Providencia sp. PROV149]|uniref:hypothetical protein n=1 Tax=Providencia sp. PROV149 TaxID=2949859 RepID=UPI00234B5D8F|nr:hypothetical protein [Providencia sp. PROV149]